MDTVRAGTLTALTTAQSVAYQFEEVNKNFDGTCNGILNHVFATGKEANESYTFKEMLQQDDKAKFVDAMEKEIDDHSKRKHWKLILRSSMPKDVKTSMAIAHLCQRMSKRLWQYGPSSASNSLMAH